MTSAESLCTCDREVQAPAHAAVRAGSRSITGRQGGAAQGGQQATWNRGAGAGSNAGSSAGSNAGAGPATGAGRRRRKKGGHRAGGGLSSAQRKISRGRCLYRDGEGIFGLHVKERNGPDCWFGPKKFFLFSFLQKKIQQILFEFKLHEFKFKSNHKQ